MVLVGIGMLVVGVLLGGILIYLWVRPKPEPAPDPQPPEPPPERQRRVTREMDTVAFEDVFDSWLGERPSVEGNGWRSVPNQNHNCYQGGATPGHTRHTSTRFRNGPVSPVSSSSTVSHVV